MKYFFEISLIFLSFVLGAYLWRTFIQPPTITTRIEWFERPVFLPSKTESKPGNNAPSTSETARRDTIILTASCDSLRDIARRLNQIFEATFIDSIAASDSLGSFFAIENTKLSADPWTRIITKERTFENAVLKLAHVQTTETIRETNWLMTGIAILVGLLIGLIGAG